MSALLELERRRGALRARSRRCTGSRSQVDEGEVVAVLGANGAGQDDDAAGVSGTVRRSGRIDFDGKPLARRARGGRAGRDRARARGPRHVHRADRDARTSGSAPTRAASASLSADIDRVVAVVPVAPRARATSRPGRSPAASSRCSRVARALMARPRLLMLDEPSLGLAPMIVREIFRIVRELNEKEGLTVLVVEQNARIALQTRVERVRPRGRAGRGRGLERRAPRERVRPTELPRLLMADFLAAGRRGARVRRRSTRRSRSRSSSSTARPGVINFAQGEMATFSTYIAWTLTTNHGWSYWPAFVVTLLASRSPAASAIHQGDHPADREGLRAARRDRHDRPAARAQRPRDAGSGRRRGARHAEPVPDPHDRHRRRRDLDPGHRHDRRRARAPWSCSGRSSSSRSSGSRCARRRSTRRRRGSSACASRGCSRSAGGSRRCSARSPGCSPRRAVFLDPNMMPALLIYAFAAAVLGGIDSPIGAVVGGLLARRRPQPDRGVRRLRRRRPAAAGGARA